MKGLLQRFFGRLSPLDQIFRKQTIVDVKEPPTDLIQSLKQGDLPKFIETINQSETVPLLALRKLTIVHNVLIHSTDFCESFQKINLSLTTKDLWLNEWILRPYSVYLYKIINSGELYRECKGKPIEISFKMLFYLINTLFDLFPCVHKMSSLYRYYHHTEKQLKTEATVDYVMTIAYEAQEFYNRFKAIITEMISKPEEHLKSESDLKMMKYVLEDVLIKINEEMKNLFLDKYYFPYGRGLGVKLMKEEDFSGPHRDFVDSLNMMDLEKKKKPKKKMTLDKFLFDQSGRLNPEAYLTLSQIRQGDLSCRQIGHQSQMCRDVKTEVRDEITEEI